MTWAKLSGGAWVSHSVAPAFFPTDYWGQADVWIPPNTFTACGEDGNHDLFGNTARFVDFGNDSLHATNVGTALAPDWRWQTSSGVTAATGPSPSTTYTVKFHYYVVGPHFNGGQVDWYVNGTLVATSTGVNKLQQNTFFLNHLPEGCCCEIYYYTTAKIGTFDGGSDIFASDFSEGLGFWTRNQAFMPSSLVLVDAPAAAPCPTLAVSPVRGLPGETLTLNGAGFAPDSPLSFFVGNVRIEDVVAMSDGAGDAHIVTTIPHIPTTGTFTADGAYLLDAVGDIACAALAVCGTKGADGITTAPDPVVATGGVTDNTNLILDYIFHDGAHWVLWQDPSALENQGTFPPPANHTLNATRISADGTSVTDYPVDTGYQWIFDKGAVSDPGIFSTRPCPAGGGGVNAPVWDLRFFFSSWAKPVYDARFASDGTSLWVGVVTRETVPYPWLDNQDACSPNPGSASQFVPLATLTSGFTSFATTVGAGYHRYNTQTVGLLDFYQGNAYPVTDAGEENSGYWSPPLAIIFAFDGSEFNRVGEVKANYCPGETLAYGNPPGVTQVAPRGSLFSRVSMCASPTDPGVCHVVWSEGGDWGRWGQATSGCASLVWDAGPVSRDYRVNYTTWSPTAKLTDQDIFHSHVDRTGWSFPWDFGFGLVNTGHTWPDQAAFAGCLQHDLRNDNTEGTPLLFLSWPQSIFSCWNTLRFPAPFWRAPPVPNDGHGDTWEDNNLLYCDTVYVYDLGGGSAVLRHQVEPPLLPTEDECNFFYTPSNVNNLTPQASNCLLANTAIDDGGGLATVSFGPQDKAFGISLPYDDPELGVPVYLIHVPWARRFGQTLGLGGSFPAGAQMRGFYRVPCDMSAGFDFLDGQRQVNFTVLEEPFGVIPEAFGSSDFFSDPKNIWVAPASAALGIGLGFNGFPGLWFDRVCNNQWEKFSAAWTPPAGGYWAGSQCPGFYYDPASDSITTVAGTSESIGGPLFAVTTQFICRGCRHCKCGTGVHLAHRF